MRWKPHKVVGVISILLAFNISVYSHSMAKQTIDKNPTPPAPVEVVPQPSHPDRVLQKAVLLCEKYKDEGLTLPVLMGLIEVESNFNPKAVSPEHPISYGLMQVLRTTATPIMKELGYKWSIANILNPEINMEVGVEYLMNLHRHFVATGHEGIDEFHVTLLAYNRGEQAVRDSLKFGYLRYLGKIKVASRKY